MAMWLSSSPRSSVTQATSKATAVTALGPCGSIRTAVDALGASASVSFVVNCDFVDDSDVIVLSFNAPVFDTYQVLVNDVQVGSFRIRITNLTALIQTHALNINFSVVKLG